MSEPSIEERYQAIQARIVEACRLAGRDPAEINLVAISKKQPPEIIREAAACGIPVFGENRVQALEQKAALCPDGLTWHLVGHLQSNN